MMDYASPNFTVSGEQATAIDAGITEVFKYITRTNNDTFTESMPSDKNTGTTVNTQTLEVRLKKQTYQSAAELMLVAHATPIIVVVGRDGSYKVMGISEGCDLTGSNIQSGGARGDFNGYDLTFTAEEVRLAPHLDSSTITALEALVSATNVTP
jgi:hypothetical protein